MKQIHIRSGNEQDLSGLLKLEQAAQACPWPEQIFSDLIRSARVRCTVVEREVESQAHQLLGFALVQSVADEASLLNMVVAPDWQGKGVGRLLLNRLIDDLMADQYIRHFFLEVRVSNFRAISLYLSCGFVEVGERRDYYQSENGLKEDALIMALPL
jgi:ribosomal-protein-alanine N-acetyltransferase